jgi:GDP-4-dehydro-6-deoxy-D-mannose reductase
MKKKAFITGITGFAGSHLARLLHSNDQFDISGTYLSESSKTTLKDLSSEIELIQLDLMDRKKVEDVVTETKPDYIFHLAALTSPKLSFDDPGKVITNNVEGQINILEAVRKSGIDSKVLITSSAEVYGNVKPSDLPIDEETPLNPTSPYAVSKIAQDFLALQYFISYKIKTIRARPFNHIGPGQTDSFAVAAFAKKIAQIEKGLIEPILYVGNLESKRDFTDVKDMVKAYMLLIEKGRWGEVFNIGSGKSFKMSEILEKLLSLSDKKIEIRQDPDLLRPSDNPELLCNPGKIEKETGWKAEISIEETLGKILEYWRGEVSES